MQGKKFSGIYHSISAIEQKLTLLKSKFPNWEPPACNPDTHACYLADDDCSYSCIRHDECKDNIETTPFGQGFVCNCVKHDPERFEFVWSCNNTAIGVDASVTDHQYG